MKVVLKAFQSKLTSKPMDFPESQGLTVDLILDMGILQRHNFAGEVTHTTTPPREYKCTFESTGMHEQYLDLDGQWKSAKVY